MKKKPTESLKTTEECMNEIEEGIHKLVEDKEKLREENRIYKEGMRILLAMSKALMKDTSGKVAEEILSLLEDFDKRERSPIISSS